MQSKRYKSATTNAYRRAVLTFIFLTTLMSLWRLPTTSYAEVKALSDNTVQMTAGDLRVLVRQVLENEAENKALKEALSSERASYSLYQQSVQELLAAQSEERKVFTETVKNLERQLNRPRLEVYGGYNTKNHMEGGMRLVWVLK